MRMTTGSEYSPSHFKISFIAASFPSHLPQRMRSRYSIRAAVILLWTA
jgi:hypothetical protein